MNATVGYIAVCIVQFIVYVIYIREMLGLRRSVWWLPVCIVFGESLNYVNETFVNNPAANSIVNFLVFLAIALFIAKGSIHKKILITFLFVVFSVLMESLVVGSLLVFNLIDMSDVAANTSMRNILLLIVQIALFLGIQIPAHFKDIKVNDDITNKQVALVFFNSCMCFVAVMIYGVYMSKTNDFSLEQVMIVCILVLLNFISYYFYNMSIQSNKIRVEKEIYHKQVDLYREWYESIKQARKEASSMRHDMNNHISALKSVAESESPAEIKVNKICEYIDRLNVNHNVIRTENSGNILIDAMIDMKKSFAAANNIEFFTDVRLPKDMKFNEQDFVVVFGNLIDNAIEGCMQNGGNVGNNIILRLKYDSGNLRMLIKNSYDGSLDGKTGSLNENFRIKTNKHNKKQHGIGLDNVKRVIEKYRGEIIWIAKDKEFSVNVLMFGFAER